MLNNKRKRSDSQNDSEKRTKQKIEDSNNIIAFSNEIELATKLSCKICNKDITKTIKLICSTCENFVYCINCALLNKSNEDNSHKNHNFHIVDKLNFNIFTSDWTAQEEVKLIKGSNYY